jgi:uncharacterized membrane protein YtjA (UPF0391 family)
MASAVAPGVRSHGQKRVHRSDEWFDDFQVDAVLPADMAASWYASLSISQRAALSNANPAIPCLLKSGIGVAWTWVSCAFARVSRKEISMSSLLKWAIVFFIISLIAALFGFGGISQGAADIAKVLFFIFLAVCVVLFILGMTIYKSVT